MRTEEKKGLGCGYLFTPTDVLKAIDVPEINVTNFLRPRFSSRQVEFVSEVVIDIETVIDDVSLMN